MIVIAIVGIISAAAMPALSAVTGANARSAAGEPAGAARYLFDTAALRHQTCRLTLDLDHAAWWAECTKDRYYAPRSGRAARHEEEDDRSLEDRFPDERDAEKRRLLAKATFAQFDDRLAKKRGLPGSAHFEEVWSQHQKEALTRGLAYVYFYPQGQSERAHIPIVDGDNAYTVVTEAFTGHARVVTGKLEVPRS
jgi:general secretion pathway protein H